MDTPIQEEITEPRRALGLYATARGQGFIGSVPRAAGGAWRSDKLLNDPELL